MFLKRRSASVPANRAMTISASPAHRRSPAALACVGLGTAAAVVGLMAGAAGAATPTTIDLGTAAAASVLAGAGVTNTGPSILDHDLDTSPTPAITGFPPGKTLGAKHAADAVARQAQSDLTTAYNTAKAAPSTSDITGVDLSGKTLTQGVYTASSGIALNGPRALTLNGGPDSVFIFQAGSTLITGSASSVQLTGGAQACNVFWQVSSSATLGTRTSFVGNILALTSIGLKTGATVDGRALARNGSVTLDSNVFTNSPCITTTSTPPTTTPPVTTPPVTTPPSPPPVTTAPVTTPPVAIAPVIKARGTTPPVTAPSTNSIPGLGTTPQTPTGSKGTSALVAAGGSTSGRGASSGSTSALAFTGLPVGPMVGVALALLLAGVLLLQFEYRHRRPSKR